MTTERRYIESRPLGSLSRCCSATQQVMSCPPSWSLITGLAYAFNSPLTARWQGEHHTPSMLGPNTPVSAFVQPLVYDPGTHYLYSMGIDWAGILLSRRLGKTLEEIVQENIFRPCGIRDITFLPRPDIIDRAMTLCTRRAGEALIAGRQPNETDAERWAAELGFERPKDPSQVGPIMSGGGGLFGTARDYLTLLRHVLACADPSIETPLISHSTFKLLFTDVLPGSTQVHTDIGTMAMGQCIHDAALHTNGTGEYLGHSPAMLVYLKDSCHGRKKGSGYWDGGAKTHFWIDPTTGIAVSPRL